MMLCFFTVIGYHHSTRDHIGSECWAHLDASPDLLIQARLETTLGVRFSSRPTRDGNCPRQLGFALRARKLL